MNWPTDKRRKFVLNEALTWKRADLHLDATAGRVFNWLVSNGLFNGFIGVRWLACQGGR